MSAICGVLDPSGTALPPGVLDQLLAQLADWPADIAGDFHQGPVAFAARVRHESEASSDAVTTCRERGLHLVFDGRLDEPDLASRLGLPGGTADPRLVLGAWQRWGEECPLQLRGDFAFALWDQPARALFCARDPFGLRPLFYRHDRGRFVFASTLGAVLAVAQPRPDLAFLKTALMYGDDIHPTRTLYRDVLRLAPGHTLRVAASGVRTRPYWTPESAPCPPREALVDAPASVAALLHEAVRVRLRSRRGLGVHLSGGLDSGSVAVIAARALRAEGRALHAFSYLPPPAAADRGRYEWGGVTAICDQERLDCSFLETTADEHLAFLQHDLARSSLLASNLFEEKVCSLAAEAGVGVLLTGWGGDEGISAHGRGAFTEMLHEGDWRRFLRETSGLLARNGGAWSPKAWAAFLLRRVLVPSLPHAWFEHVPLSGVLPPALPPFLHREAAALLRPVEPAPRPPLRPEYASVRAGMTALVGSGHLARRAEAWAAQAGRHGLVHRYPLLDRRLVELALALPARAYFDGGEGRLLFRRATANLLPAAIRAVAKTTEPAIARSRAAHFEAWARWLAEARSQPPPVGCVVVDRATLPILSGPEAYAGRARLRRTLMALQAEEVLTVCGGWG